MSLAWRAKDAKARVREPIRILLVDDHALLRSGLRLLIEDRGGMEVVGEASNRREALELAEEHVPDIVLLDVDLGKECALDFLPELIDVAPGCRIILLTGITDPEVHQRAVSLGAVGLVTKERAVEVLLVAIEKVHAGEVWLERSLTASVLKSMASRRKAQEDPEKARIAELTTRELEVIRLVAEGLRNRQVAERLFISEITVRHHLTSIYSKLQVSDRLELLIFALRHSLAQIPR